MSFITNIGKTVLSTASIVGYHTQKHAPEILIVGGIIGMGVTTVKACKSTIKVNEAIKESNEVLTNVKKVMDGEIELTSEYTEEDAKSDRIWAYTNTTKAIVKYYGPVVAIGAGSIASILAGYNIINKRNAALVAAYTAIDTSFKKYRQRVVEDLGEEADWKYRTGMTEKKVELTETDEEGKEKKVKAKVNTVESEESVDYIVNFLRDAVYIPNKNNHQMNKWLIEQAETNANVRLQTYKHITLNDVYDMLGVPRRDCGQIVGWTLDGSGDNAVKFIIKEIYDEEYDQYNFLIDFNVDGIMFNKIEKARTI